jgi:methyltransferase-like protein
VASPGYTSLPGEPDSDLKSHLMSVIEAFKEDINNSLKEIQEEAIKQLRKMNKTVQTLKGK